MFPLISFAQDQKEAKAFIVKVLSEQKNPFAYIPFNRDLFLPTEEELNKRENKNYHPDHGRSAGPVIFLSASDSTYHRETFVDAYGAPLKTNIGTGGRRFKEESFFRRKQDFHLSQYPNMGRFLYFFSARKPD